MVSILDDIKSLYDARGEEIEHWLQRQRAIAAPFIYSSVDLRHSGLRLVPVDTNLFPAGFNNLSPAARKRASRFIQRLLEEEYPQAKRIAIVPENHTRNLAYLDNLATLIDLFEAAGVDVAFGSLAAPSGGPVTMTSPSGKIMAAQPMLRDGNTLLLESGFHPDLVILNNDMSAGPAGILLDITQPVLPPVGMGWYQRSKSRHFAAYKMLIDDFCQTFVLDPWLFSAEFYHCGKVDFKEHVGLDCVAKGVEKVLARVREKHAQYGIETEPYVFIKADSGTYGMGIITVRSPDEIFELNKKTRNKMQVIKEGTRVSEVIIQEGIPTVDLVNNKPAEPMVYLIDGIPTGGMYRVNGARDAFNNLNAAGMEFTGMCDEKEGIKNANPVRDCHFHAYGIVAAIAALAAAREPHS